MFNNMEELSYYVNDDSIWDVGAFGGVGHTAEVQESGWIVGDQMIQLS